MSPSDPINALADQLSNFHISKRFLHEKAISAALSRAMSSHSDPIAYAAKVKASKGRIVPIDRRDPFLTWNRNWTDIIDLRAEDRRRPRSKHLSGTLLWDPFYDVPKMSPYSHAECKAEARCIPFWQPPAYNYLSFIPYVKAEKEIMAREDSRKDLAWMTAAMDLALEHDLLGALYRDAINQHRDIHQGTQGTAGYKEICPQANAFYYDLSHELKEDEKAVQEEIKKNDRLHGKGYSATWHLKRDIWAESGKHFHK